MNSGGVSYKQSGEKRPSENEETSDSKRPRREDGNVFNHEVYGILNDDDDSPSTPDLGSKSLKKGNTTPINTPVRNGDGADQIASKEPGREVTSEEKDSRANIVSVDLCDGGYVLEIKRRKISTDEEEEKKTPEKMAQSAGMLFVHADILRELGDKLLAQYRASLPSFFTTKSSAT